MTGDGGEARRRRGARAAAGRRLGGEPLDARRERGRRVCDASRHSASGTPLGGLFSGASKFASTFFPPGDTVEKIFQKNGSRETFSGPT